MSDTSPISNLIDLDHVWLLPRLFQEVVIPTKVAYELGQNQGFQTKWQVVQSSDWLVIRSPNEAFLPLPTTEKPLDPGETEAIALALELKADLLLIDERAGFKVAQSLNIRTLGVLGMLVEAKRTHLVPSVKPLLDQLREEIGFWVSEKLYQQILTLTDESE